MNKVAVLLLASVQIFFGCIHLQEDTMAAHAKSHQKSATTVELRKELESLSGAGDFKGVQSLVSSDQEHILKVEDLNNSLFSAIDSGSVDTINVLLDAGADINAKLEGNEYTPLMEAIDKGNEHVAVALILRGADLNARSYAGRSALKYAVRQHGLYNHLLNVVKLLVQKGADINSQDLGGSTPLMSAAVHNDSEVVRLLIENGADINVKDSDGNTALFYAKLNGNNEKTVNLLDAKK